MFGKGQGRILILKLKNTRSDPGYTFLLDSPLVNYSTVAIGARKKRSAVYLLEDNFIIF